MTHSERLQAQPRNPWSRFRAVLDLVARNELARAQEILDGVTYHPRIDDEILNIYAGQLRHAWTNSDLPRRIDTPADYLSNPGGRLMTPLRFLKAGRKVPKPYPPHMALPPLVGERNDARFIEEAAAAQMPRGRAENVRLHVIYSPKAPSQTDRTFDALTRQDFPGQLSATAFAPDQPAGSRKTAGGRFESLAQSVLSREAAVHILRIAEESDLVLFLDGSVSADDLLLLRMSWHAGISDRLVQPLVEHTAEGDLATPFSAQVAGARFTTRFPFREMQGLNMAVPAPVLRQVGAPDSRFQDTFHAGRELAFRLYNAGCYFAPLAVKELAGISDPKAHPEDAALYRGLCPNNWDRKKDKSYETPKVSVYIPAYNASRFIQRAVDSVLDQDVQDLNVCIADDGSVDGTRKLLERRYGNEPRVTRLDNRNGGIGFASNQAIGLSNSLYIGQLDSDDCLKPGAVRRLMEYLDENPDVVCCYSSCERIDAEGNFVDNEYSWPVFSREKMMITSITHHFRMFRRYAWNRTSRFREDIVNAVDYDMFLKLSETGQFHHVEEVLYQRRWHGANTSMVNEGHQTTNTYRVQREALKRLGLDNLWDVHAPDPAEPRRVTYRLRDDAGMVLFWPDYSYSNPYQKLLYHKMRAHTEVVAGDIDAALDLIQRKDGPARLTFHLHWLNFLFADTDAAGARRNADAFAAKLENFVRKGGQLIWTIHNTVSHDSPHREVEAGLSARIAELAHVLHFHCAASVAEVREHFPVPQEKVRVSPHGSYTGCYPDYVPRAAARRALGLEPEDEVLLFAGQVRPYKGVEQLVTVFRRILTDRPRALLLLGGAQSFDPLAGLNPGLSPEERARIRVADRFLDNAELQLFFGAADMAVYPYRHILTSGSMLLALTFATPVVIPEVAMTREVLAGREAGVLYDPNGGDAALETAIREGLARKDAGKADAMRAEAHALAEKLDWPDFSSVLAGNVPD